MQIRSANLKQAELKNGPAIWKIRPFLELSTQDGNSGDKDTEQGIKNRAA
jgi:hypothetical protein